MKKSWQYSNYAPIHDEESRFCELHTSIIEVMSKPVERNFESSSATYYEYQVDQLPNTTKDTSKDDVEEMRS